ncbi:hypothetical protein ACHAQH_007329 [Verticillium albo-atrum]
MPPKRYIRPRPRARRASSQQKVTQAPSQQVLPVAKHQRPPIFSLTSESQTSASKSIQQPEPTPGHGTFGSSSRLPPQKPSASQIQRIKVEDTALKGYASSSTHSIVNPPYRPTTNTLTSDQHEVLLRHRFSTPTIHTLISIPYAASPNIILQKACLASEINSHTLLPAEKALFSTLNAAATTIWPVALSTPTLAWHKAFLIAQNHPSGKSWLYIPRITPKDRNGLGNESKQITCLIRRILRCAADLAALRHDGVTVRHALELSRSIAAGAWEGATHELQQVKDVGPKKIEMLQAAGISTVRALADMEFYNVDRILKRNPPFGSGLIMQLKHFPRLKMTVRFERWAANSDIPAIDSLPEKARSTRPGQRLAIVRARVRCLNVEVPLWKGKTH